LEGKRNELNSSGVTAGEAFVLRLFKDGDGFDLISDGFQRGPEREQRVLDDLRRGNSPNRISAGEFANRRLGTG
jgi:hypothetical protein